MPFTSISSLDKFVPEGTWPPRAPDDFWSRSFWLREPENLLTPGQVGEQRSADSSCQQFLSPQPPSASQTRMGIELGVWITGTTEHVCHMAISAFLTDNFGRICIGLPNIGLGSLKIKKKMWLNSKYWAYWFCDFGPLINLTLGLCFLTLLLRKIMTLGRIEGKRRRGQQRMRWVDIITNSVDMNLSKLSETMEDRGAWRAAVHSITKSQTWLSDWITTQRKIIHIKFITLWALSEYWCHYYFLYYFYETD